MDNIIPRTKRVKAFTITEGDSIGNSHRGKNGSLFITHTIIRISEIDRNTLNFDYEAGGFGLYQRQSLVNKIIG